MNVVLNGFGTATDINKTRDDLAKIYDVSVTYSAADMSKPEQIGQMVEDASRIFGQVGILVNNTGILHAGPVEVLPPDSIMAINLSAVFHAIRTVLPGMKAQRFGRIVNVLSALGLVGAANYAAYAASKHAVSGLTKAAALETAQNGMTINAVCLGYVRTLLVEHEIEEVAKARSVSAEQAVRHILGQVQPAGRFVTVDQIGALVSFLCSDLGHGGRYLYRRRLDRRVMF